MSPRRSRLRSLERRLDKAIRLLRHIGARRQRRAWVPVGIRVQLTTASDDDDPEPDMPSSSNTLLPRMQAFALGVILVGFFAILVLLFFRDVQPGAKDLISSMIEVLKNALLIAIGFAFGTSASSARKDEMLAASVPVTQLPDGSAGGSTKVLTSVTTESKS